MIDLTVSERTAGPLFVTADGRRLDRHSAARIVRRVTRRAGIAKHAGPHTLRQAFITAALDAGCRCGTCRRPPRTLADCSGYPHTSHTTWRELHLPATELNYD